MAFLVLYNDVDKELSEEIERLQKLENIGCSNSMHEEVGRGHENSHEDTPADETLGRSSTNLMKKRKYVHSTEDTATRSVDVELDRPADQHVDGDKVSAAPQSFQQVSELYSL